MQMLCKCCCLLTPSCVQIRKWMREAGMRTWQDGVGNVHGRLDGRARDAPALLLGSHYDTVTDAGKYDGAMGIVVAIAAVKAVILQVLLLLGALLHAPALLLGLPVPRPSQHG